MPSSIYGSRLVTACCMIHYIQSYSHAYRQVRSHLVQKPICGMCLCSQDQESSLHSKFAQTLCPNLKGIRNENQKTTEGRILSQRLGKNSGMPLTVYAFLMNLLAPCTDLWDIGIGCYHLLHRVLEFHDELDVLSLLLLPTNASLCCCLCCYLCCCLTITRRLDDKLPTLVYSIPNTHKRASIELWNASCFCNTRALDTCAEA